MEWRSSARRLRIFWPIVFFAALTLLIFHSVLIRPAAGAVISVQANDLVSEFLPLRAFGFEQLRHNHIPLWNPYVYGGVPFMGGMQSALFYPLDWLHLLLPLAPAVNWIAALHVFLSACTMFIWVRSRGASVAGAALAGVMFMFCGPLFLRTYAGHLSHLSLMPWPPLLMWSIDRLSQSGRASWMFAGTFVVAMEILTGSPQYVYYTGLITGLYVGLLLWKSPHRVTLIGGVALMFILASLLTAVQLFTAVQAAGESVRSGGTPFAFASMISLPPENLLTFIMPTFFGRLPIDSAPNTFVYFGRGYLWESSQFISLSGFALALLAVIRRWKRNSPMFIIVMVAIVLALGSHLPIYRLLFDHLPMYGSFRGVGKFSFFAAMFLCPLAADGLDLLSTGDRRAAGAAAIALGAVAVVLTLVAVSVTNSAGARDSAWARFARPIATSHEVKFATVPFDAEFMRTSAQNAAAAAAGAALVAAVAALSFAASRFWPRASVGLVALATLEMLLFARSNWTTTSADPSYPAPWRAAISSMPKDDRVVHLAVGGNSFDTYLEWSMVVRAPNAWGYEPPVLKRYAELLTASQGLPASGASDYLDITQVNSAVFQMLRCGLGLTGKGDQPTTVVLPTPMKVAQLVDRCIVAHGRDAVLGAVLAPEFNPRKAVVLETAPAIAPVAGDGGHVEVVEVSTDELDIQATTPQPKLLLITNAYSSGWRATPVDSTGPQKNYEIMPANHALMAIPLAAGEHHIRLKYSPLAFRVGGVVSMVTWPIYLVSCAVFVRRRKR